MDEPHLRGSLVTLIRWTCNGHNRSNLRRSLLRAHSEPCERVVRCMEKRIGPELRRALEKCDVQSNRAQVGGNDDHATILHAAHALAEAALSW